MIKPLIARATNVNNQGPAFENIEKLIPGFIAKTMLKNGVTSMTEPAESVFKIRAFDAESNKTTNAAIKK